MKTLVQRVLKRVGLYNRVKVSHAYDLYWSIFDRSVVAGMRGEIRFYRRLLNGLRPGSLVFDVGANDGFKTAILLRLGARVVAIEPDRTNQQVLREKFLMLRLFPWPVAIVGKALSDKESVTTMWIDQPGSAKNTLSQKWVDTLRGDDGRFGYHHDFSCRETVETTTLDQLVSVYGMPFFIKIDVEGYEPHVLAGLHQVVPYLSFEVNLPQFMAEGQRCVDMLHGLHAHGKFNYVTGDYREGLVLPEWLDAQKFSRVLMQCTQSSIEVFWRSDSSHLGWPPTY